MKQYIVATVAILLAFSPGASAPQDDQRQQRKIPEFEKQLHVNLVLLDILVFDKSGKFIPGLGIEDFIVLEEGKEVDINSVDEYFLIGDALMTGDPDKTLYDSPPRNIIFILDKFFSSTRAIGHGKETILEFSKKNLLPGDRTMLLTYERTFRVIQDLTTDHRKLEQAVLGVPAISASGETPELQMNLGSDADAEFAMTGMQISNDNLFSNSIDSFKNIRFQNEVRNYLSKLQLLAKSFKSLPGRKTVILLSEGYDERFMSENLVSGFRDMDEMTRRAMGDESPETLMPVEDAAGRRLSNTLMGIYTEMVSKINDSNTSFYVVDLASFGGERTRADQFHQQSLTQRADYSNSRFQSLAGLAGNSGGKIYNMASNLDKVLDDINRDISNYYIISYVTPDVSSEGKFRNVTVKARNSAFSVRSRKGYFESNPYEKMDNRDRYIHLMEGFFQTEPENELMAGSSVFFLPVFSDTVIGSISIEIPAELLGSAGDQSVEMIGSVQDQRKKRIDAFHNVISYKEKYDQILQDGALRLQAPLVFTSGYNHMRTTVRDNSTGKRYHIFSEFITRGAQPDELFMSSIIMFDENGHAASTDKYDLKVSDSGDVSGYEGYNAPNPLRITVGMPIFPRLNLVFSPEEMPIVFFSAGNYWQDPITKKVDFFIDYTAVDGDGNEFVIPVARERILPVAGTARINVLSKLALGGLQPGEYKLRVRFLDRERMQGAQRELDFNIQ